MNNFVVLVQKFDLLASRPLNEIEIEISWRPRLTKKYRSESELSSSIFETEFSILMLGDLNSDGKKRGSRWKIFGYAWSTLSWFARFVKIWCILPMVMQSVSSVTPCGPCISFYFTTAHPKYCTTKGALIVRRVFQRYTKAKVPWIWPVVRHMI